VLIEQVGGELREQVVHRDPGLAMHAPGRDVVEPSSAIWSSIVSSPALSRGTVPASASAFSVTVIVASMCRGTPETVLRGHGQTDDSP
jgi:hypothetical protein